MKYLRRSLKALSWLMLATGALAAVGLAALVAANWNDDALSHAAQQALRYAPPTEQALEGNGYLIVWGLDAPTDGDVVGNAMTLGRQRLAREIERRRWIENYGDISDSMPPTIPVESSGEGVLPKRLRCPAGEPDCFHWYRRYETEIEALALENRPLLQRLSAAANAPQFSNPAPFYLLVDFPPFARLSHTHELWLAQAALEWAQGRPQRAMDTARQAVRLRSRLASSSNNLIAAMIALALQLRELRWLSEASAHTGPQTPAAVVKEVEDLLSAPPVSLNQALEGEKQFMASVLYPLKDPGLFNAPGVAVPTWWQLPLNWAGNLGFLPRQTLNRSINYLQQVQTISTLPPHQWNAAFAELMRQWEEGGACAPWKRLRNITGLCLEATTRFSYQSYAQRVADIEGYRRLVLLQHRASAQQVRWTDLPAWLAQSPQELRNPYTLQPMQWDARENSLVFEGRESQNQHPDRSPIYRVRLRG